MCRISNSFHGITAPASFWKPLVSLQGYKSGLLRRNHSATLKSSWKVITGCFDSKHSSKYAKAETYKQVSGLLGFKFRTPAAGTPIFSHCYYGAIVGGMNVDNRNPVTRGADSGWQSESHLLLAPRSFLLLFMLLPHVCAELTLYHIGLGVRNAIKL